jgi:hypothetical protein
MFQFSTKLIILLLNISPALFNEYLCPTDAYRWIIFDNTTKQIYRWIYDKNTKQFNQDVSLINRIEIGENFEVICCDIHQRMYHAIYITKKHFEINWKCDDDTNIGEIKIKSWLFSQIISPEKLYLQIGNFYRSKIIQPEDNRIIRINMKIIKQILEQISFDENQTTIFYTLHLVYGQQQDSITIPIRPLFEERLYILPLYSNQKNDSYINIDCPTM